MQQYLERVTTWLVEASALVPYEYFQLPVAGQEGAVYRERVYCYELYHQWRCRWETISAYSLGGEIDKSGHPLIRNSAKPDFLVHVPGNMKKNLLAVEVKPANARIRKIVKDLRTLTYFRRRLGNDENYFGAYFWVYGVLTNDWPDLAREIAGRVRDDFEIDLRLIRPVIHASSSNAATFVEWE